MWKATPQITCVILLAILNGGPWTNWHAASAQKNLPTELQATYVMSEIRLHFCPDGRETCMPSEGGVRYICCDSYSNQCSIDAVADHSMCMEDDQVYACGYRDAIVCRYEDGRGSCIYSNSSSRSIEPLCVCKENGTWPSSDARASQIRRSCREDNSMGDQTTGTTDPHLSGEDDSVNIMAIVLGAILVIVLLVLLLVCLLKRRRRHLSGKKATNPTNSSAVSSAERAQMPEPLVLGDTDYSYAYDHWPRSNPASDTGKPKPVNDTGGNRYEENEASGSASITAGNSPETREVPKYYELGQSQDGSKGRETPQGPKYYYEIGESLHAAKGGKTPQAPKYDEVRRRPPTGSNQKTPQDHEYFELEQSRDAAKGGKTPQAPKYDEVRRNNQKRPQDPTYFELSRPQDTDAETVFSQVDESMKPSPGGFSNQGYDQACMPSKQTAKVAQSGYEPLKMPSSAAQRNDTPPEYDHLNNATGIRLQKVELPEKEDDIQYASVNV